MIEWINKFSPDVTYVDREGNRYTFVRKASGSSVTLWQDANNQPVCRNEKGQYRWDNKEDPRDIVGVV